MAIATKVPIQALSDTSICLKILKEQTDIYNLSFRKMLEEEFEKIFISDEDSDDSDSCIILFVRGGSK